MGDGDIATADEQERIQTFLSMLRDRGRHERTLMAYQHDWQHLARWFEHNRHESLTLSRLTAEDVRRYLRWGQRKGFKPSTLNRRLTFIKQYVAWAERHNGISSEQRKLIKRIPILKAHHEPPHALTDEETRRLLTQVRRRGSKRDRAIIITLLYTGLRVGELVALNVADVHDDPDGLIIVVRQEVAKGGLERTVPVPFEAEAALLDHLEDDSGVGLLFTGRQGALRPESIGAIVRKYAGFARLERVTPHVLRHTFAFNFLADHDNDLVALADVLGYTDLNSTRMYLVKG